MTAKRELPQNKTTNTSPSKTRKLNEDSPPRKHAAIATSHHEITEEEAAQYDRQIRLWGFDAQRRLRNARILIISCTGLSNEVCKNIVLAGVGSLTIADGGKVQDMDLGSQFLIDEADLGKPRASAIKIRLQNLNPRVHIDTIDQDILKEGARPDSFFQSFNVVCLMSGSIDEIIRINEICRQKNVKFWAAEMSGFYGFFFTDMGKHSYIEENKFVDKSTDGMKVVTTQKEAAYPSFQTCMTKTWNITSPKAFKRKMSPVYFGIMAILEFLKMKKYTRRQTMDEEGMQEMVEYTQKWIVSKGIDAAVLPQEKIRSMYTTFGLDFSPVCAIVGGILSQEIIKCVSEKDLPIKNMFCFDGLLSQGVVMDV